MMLISIIQYFNNFNTSFIKGYEDNNYIKIKFIDITGFLLCRTARSYTNYITYV